MDVRKSTAPTPEKKKSLECWIWDATCGSGGLKAVTQSAKGLQEIFIRTEAGMEDAIAEAILKL